MSRRFCLFFFFWGGKGEFLGVLFHLECFLWCILRLLFGLSGKKWLEFVVFLGKGNFWKEREEKTSSKARKSCRFSCKPTISLASNFSFPNKSLMISTAFVSGSAHFSEAQVQTGPGEVLITSAGGVVQVQKAERAPTRWV